MTALFISSHLLLQYIFEPIRVAFVKTEGRVETPRKRSKYAMYASTQKVRTVPLQWSKGFKI